MDLHTDQWWAPDPIDRKKDFLPPASITRKKFNYEINKNILNNDDLIARPAVSNVLIMLNGMSHENGGTMVVPGSHLFGRHPEKEIDTDINHAAEGHLVALQTEDFGTTALIRQKNQELL